MDKPDAGPPSRLPLACTHFKLRQLNRLVGRHYDAQLAGCGLKGTQFSLLTAIGSVRAIRPGDLARLLSLDASTLTRNLKPLIEAGWVEVSAGEDGRSRSVAITAAGRDKRAAARAHWRAAQQQVTALLGAATVDELHALIDRCQERLLAAEPGPDVAPSPEPGLRSR